MDQPKQLFAVYLPQADHWMALSSAAVAGALADGYTVVTYVPLDEQAPTEDRDGESKS